MAEAIIWYFCSAGSHKSRLNALRSGSSRPPFLGLFKMASPKNDSVAGWSRQCIFWVKDLGLMFHVIGIKKCKGSVKIEKSAPIPRVCFCAQSGPCICKLFAPHVRNHCKCQQFQHQTSNAKQVTFKTLPVEIFKHCSLSPLHRGVQFNMLGIYLLYATSYKKNWGIQVFAFKFIKVELWAKLIFHFVVRG